jgi:hypothetical protein
MKFSVIATLATLAAPILFSMGGCSLASHDYGDYDRHAYYYPNRYERDYYRRDLYRRPVVVAPGRPYYAPAPHYVPPRGHTVVVRPDGRRVYVRDY